MMWPIGGATDKGSGEECGYSFGELAAFDGMARRPAAMTIW